MFTAITKRSIQRSSIRSFSMSSVARTNEAPSKQDAFGEREKAQENVYIKKHEAEQLRALKEKLEQQKQTIDKLEKEIKDIKK
jgi:small-conductance mechanosensitive channel